MSYTFPNRRTQVTNLVVRSTATLDPGAVAINWGSGGIPSGDLTVTGNLTVLGTTTFGGNVLIQSNLTVSNLITALEDIYVKNNLYVGNLANLSRLDVTNAATMANLTVLSNLVAQYISVYDINATNNYFLYGDIFTGGGGGGGINPNYCPSLTLQPGANITLNGGSIFGATSIGTNTLTVNASANIGNLVVQGTSNISNLIVPGYSNLYGNVTMFSNLAVNIDEYVKGLLSAPLIETMQINFEDGGSGGGGGGGGGVGTLDAVVNTGNTTSNTVIFNGTVGFVTNNGVGIANTNPGEHLLTVGSNVYIDDGIVGFNNGIYFTSQNSRTLTVGPSPFHDGEVIYMTTLNGDLIQVGTANSTVAIGTLAGTTQSAAAIAIGSFAGQLQDPHAIAIGSAAGNNLQLRNAIAIGRNAGNENQQENAIAVGHGPGLNFQSSNAISIGYYAGSNLQSESSIAIGVNAGRESQNTSAIAIGSSAGRAYQGINTISIGFNTGFVGQQDGAIAIGKDAGYLNQGENSIVIGTKAGYTRSNTNTIILNATGIDLSSNNSNAFYVSPVRQSTFGSGLVTPLGYTSNCEIVRSPYLNFGSSILGGNGSNLFMGVSDSVQVAGHIVSVRGGSTTAVSNLTANVTIVSNTISDTCGKVNFSLVSTQGNLVRVTFSNPYSPSPIVVLTQEGAGGLIPYANNVSGSSFDISSGVLSNGSFTVNYMVMGVV
jgi:hypothetical protein